MMHPKKTRLLSLLGYAVALLVIQATIIRTGLVPNENSIWLYNGLASLLFGSRLLNPYFTPPVDAATNAFAALSSLVAAGLVVPKGTYEYAVLWISCAACVGILFASIAVLIARPPIGSPIPAWIAITDKFVRGVGSPNVIFTLVIFVCVWLFHRDFSFEVFAITAAVAAIVILHPLEAIADFYSWVIELLQPRSHPMAIGAVAAYQSPDIVLVRHQDIAQVPKGSTAVVSGTDGTWLLGIALNYVGRDEGNLLRMLTTQLPNQLKEIAASQLHKIQPGSAFVLTVTEEQAAAIPTLSWVSRLCGIVDSETSSETLRFEVIDEKELSEGRLVEVRIGEHRSVLFQLTEGITHEDIVQQKNKYGYARATAKKIGRWDDGAGRFSHVNWLPRINAPVFLRDDAEFIPNENYIGHFPRTSYGVSIDISQAVTHNTAILGILGIGKTYFTAELIERAIRSGVKVLCLDLTNQYFDLLAPYVNPADAALDQQLVAAGQGGVANQHSEQGGSRRAFKQAVENQMRAFANPASQGMLRIINPAHYIVTKQTSKYFQNSAELTTLTPSEIASIFSDAALLVSQELGMTDAARLCLVYEEAHSLVPEWNSVASDGDKNATATSARAILQGRKFGLGCLLVTQRTANVTKTILNQCNTIVAMRTFDDTGKDFLSNYIGSSYAAVLPSLLPRHAVVFGKASSCENPVLLKLNDRPDFLAAFRPNADLI